MAGIGIGIGLGITRSGKSRNWTPLIAPSDLTAVFDAGSVKLDWTSTGVIQIWVSIDGGTYVLLTTTASNAITYTDSVSKGGTVDYKVRVVSGDRYSDFSNIAGVIWTPLLLNTKALFWGVASEESGGHLPNKVTGASDYLTVTGSPKTYQCPNTAPYIAADTDYIWFRTNAAQRTVTTAELIGYDLQRTPVKYLDDSPNTIEEIIILKATEVLTASERDWLFAYMHLPILWDNTLSIYGRVKYNRGVLQQLWAVEVVTLLSDTFTGADTTRLNAHTMDVGAGWTEAAGVWTIVSNKATEGTQAGAVYLAVADCGRTDFDVRVEALLPASSVTKAEPGIVFRYQDTTHYWFLAYYYDGTSASIRLNVDGSNLGNTTVTHVLNSTIQLRAVTSGNVIKAYFNDTLMFTVTNATYNTKTKVGLLKYRAPAWPDNPMDNFNCYGPYI